ncbi:MAG: acyl-CoA dehydrogenase family protein [Gammaproteobacteria bacterium]|nr:acyl-CoA dehydrogenase family protein [Gammaproteobacteria bacterium]
MNRVLSDEQRSVYEAAQHFARERLAQGYQTREVEGSFERALVRELGDLGLLGSELPVAYGGLGLSGETAGLLVEAVAYADINIGYVQIIASLCGAILVDHATPALAAEWLPRMCRGEAVVGLALTEPRGGSDAAHLVLRARRDGNDYVLDGEKTSITLVDQADGFVVFARTGEPQSGARGVSAFLVDANAPGISTTRLSSVGGRASGRGSLFFDSVRVPVTRRLGAEGEGFGQVMQGFDYSRALIGLQCLAAAQASLDETWDYVHQREAFGAPLSSFQGVSFALAEHETNVEAARQLCYHTLRLRDAGLPHTVEAAMGKRLAPLSAFEAIHKCLLLHGHAGYDLATKHQQRLRDVMGLEIGDGTAEIMNHIISRRRQREFGTS